MALIISAAGLLCGCAPVMVHRAPLTSTTGGNGLGEQMEFWHTLEDQPLATNDEAFHALLLYCDDADKAADYPGRVAALKKRGMLPAAFNEPAQAAVTRGTLAVALARKLGVRGGWAMAVLGPTPRYATRELVYLGVFPPSSPRQTLTGAELVGIIGRVRDYEEGAVDAAPFASGEGAPAIAGVGLPR